MDAVVASQKRDLEELLRESSLDAFVLALETINHISVRYRFQSFLFLLCNAWELALKARLIRDAGSDDVIYFRKNWVSPSQDRKPCVIVSGRFTPTRITRSAEI